MFSNTSFSEMISYNGNGRWIKNVVVILISVIVTLLCSRFFKSDTIQIRVVVESPKIISYQVYYSRDNLGFNDENSLKISNKYINSSELLEFVIPSISIDGVRLHFGQGGETGNIILHSLKINDQNISLPYVFSHGELNDIDHIHWNNSSAVISNHKLNPYVVLPKELSNYKAKRRYNLFPLLTVFIVTMLLAEALLFCYFPHFYAKDAAKGKVTGNLVFVSIIAILLFLPITHFDKRDASIEENRMLASFPSIHTKGGLNHNFGKEFEAWLNDRFAGRSTYIRLYDFYNSLFYVGNLENEKAFVGLDDWLFYKKENSIELFQGKLDFTANQLHIIAANLQQQKQWLASQNIAYSVLIVPNKEDVYFEFYNPYIHKSAKNDRIQQLKNYLDNNDYNISLVYPLDFYLKKKGEDKLLYCKNDTHWSEYGAFLGYLAWMEQVTTLKQDICVLRADQFEFINKTHSLPGDLQLILKLDKDPRYSVIQYTVPTLIEGCKYKETESIQDSRNHSIIRTVCPNKNYKVVVFRDSFAGALLPYLSSTFKEVVYVWTHDIGTYREFIRKEKPDIVLHEMVSRYSHLLLVKPDATKGEP